MTLVDLVSGLWLKPTALVSAAFGITAIMRHTRAAPRHAVWTVGISALMALPLLAAALPDLRVTLLDESIRRASAWAPSSPVSRDVSPVARIGSPSSLQDDRLSTPAGTSTASDRVARFAFLVWALGAVLLLWRRLAAERRVYLLAISANAVSDRLNATASRVARRFRLRSAAVRTSAHVSSPAVVGLINPVVLLPDAAESWDETDLEIVLVHEFGHVQRRDCLLNLCADVAMALYWCNPIVALAARRMRLEGERSCDERVISAGAEPHAYAELLLRLARESWCALTRSAAATAMSRARELESRIIALLDAREPRRPISRGATALLIAIGVAITLPTAAFSLGAADQPIEQVMTQEPDRIGDVLASPTSERVPLRIEAHDLEQRTSQALAGRDSVLVRLLATALQHVPTHDGDLVAERAVWALSRATNGRLIDPLLESLDDSDWRVQSYAAWTLAVAGDPRAVPRLVPLVQHRVWRVRAMAAYALRQLGDGRALATMHAALSDPAWQVRSEAVQYLAAVGGEGVDTAIRARLTDRHVAVRRAAEQALGIP